MLYDYDDRFRQFKAPDIKSRLQLAALFAATSTHLPDPRVGIPGSAMAMTLVRHSWVHHPLAEDELEKLQRVALFTAPAPALHILCKKLEDSSVQLRFLHVSKDPNDNSKLIMPLFARVVPSDHDSITEYRQGIESGSISIHHQLTPQEEILFDCFPKPLRYATPSAPSIPEAIDELVANIENTLAAYVVSKSSNQESREPCPIQSEDHPTALGEYYAKGCQASWNLHHEQPTKTVKNIQALDVLVGMRLDDVREALGRLERKIRLALKGESTPATSFFRMRRAAGVIPEATVSDWVRCLWLPHSALLQSLNPQLSDEDCLSLRRHIVHWLQLCVLHDRLCRLHRLLQTEESEAVRALLVRELLTKREWHPADHLQWLAFEAEGRLQIRPEQYHIAKCMMADDQHPIVQLNMGEGKTRVILPLLLLHHTSVASSRDSLLRLVFLPQLLDDAYLYLHTHLRASAVFDKCLVRLPFHRDVVPTLDSLRVLRSLLDRCQRIGGALLTAPAHILSMHLKCDELWLKHRQSADETTTRIRTSLRQILEVIPFRDIYDECDEILRHTYQLIYAAGKGDKLPQGPRRWQAVQAVLRCMRNAWLYTHDELQEQRIKVAQDSAAQSKGKGKEVSSEEEENEQQARKARRPVIEELGHLLRQEMDIRTNDSLGSFGTWRLKTKPEDLQEVERKANELILQSLYEQPPRELDWLQQVRDRWDELKKAITDGSAKLEMPANLSETQRADVLALRGLLGHGLLLATLVLRSRVDFGIDVRREKRVAVPFRANDTPSERSEFAHMDRCLLLTHLAYYDRGLSHEQLHEACRKLKSLRPNQRAEYYGRWFNLVKEQMTDEEREELRDERRIDLTNSLQWVRLCRFYRFNVETINFWLEMIVLPEDTVHYEERLTATPWMLVKTSERSSGFSGTNDNNLLLPSTMRPYEPSQAHQESPLRALSATNGRMLACLQTSARVHIVGEKDTDAIWQDALRLALEKKVNAFIDAGALLVGVSTADAAQFIRKTMEEPYRGVVYSQVDENGRQEWKVLGKQGELWPLASSPVRERDAFVLFDQHQCRGADMKLRQEAKALLSLGPRLCKDALMQAAGRMRQLGRGQTLEFVLPKTIALDIQRVCKLDDPAAPLRPHHLLRWVMANTIAATERALPMWARQGIHYARARMHGDSALVDKEPVSLDSLYSSERGQVSVAEGIRRELKALLAIQSDAPAGEIERVVVTYGKDVLMTGGRTDEECERELERFVEQEEEQMKEELHHHQAKDIKWNVSQALIASHPQAIPIMQTRIIPFTDMLRRVNEAWMAIPWDKAGADRIFCTANFAGPLLFNIGTRFAQPGHMHTANAYLLWPGRDQVLLLSPWEADAALRALWKMQLEGTERPGGSPVLGHVTYARRAADGYGGGAEVGSIPFNLPTNSPGRPSAPILAALQLFNGETNIGESEADPRRRVVEDLIPSPEAAHQAQHFAQARGKDDELAMSHLEKVIQRRK